jgi:protein-S-isoprenylcysteine O-methyltransferase Ste14
MAVTIIPAVARTFAWLGAVLFLLSLSYFLFAYVVIFRAPAAAGNAAAATAWNVALFTIFAGHHSLFARERVRAAVARMLPAGLERSFYVWVASLLFASVMFLWQPVPGVAWLVESGWRWPLWALQAFGALLSLRSAAVIDIWELNGLRQLDDTRRGGTGKAGPTGDVFRTTGPYGWVRHPIYTGWLLIVFATPVMTMTRLVFAAVSCAYLLIGIQFEERSMRASPPGAYERYMSQVRWKLLPGIY